MIKSLKYSPVIFIFIVIIAVIYGNSNYKYDNNNIKNYYKETKPLKKISDIIFEKKLYSTFEKIKLFDINKNNSDNIGLNKFASKYTSLKINNAALRDLIVKNPQDITLDIPLANNSVLELELTRQQILSPDFKVYKMTPLGKRQVNYTPGIYYDGIIKGNRNSIASISIFKNEVIGIISDESGNYNLGSILDGKKLTDNYIYYSDNDVRVKNKFKCDADNYNKKLTKPVIAHNYGNNIDARLPVNISIVSDYQTYLDKNSDTSQVVNYITGFMNSVFTIYQNEYLPINISEISYYTFPDPYRNLNDPISILLAFGGTTQNSFNGNLAHLISTRTDNFGGISWIRTLGSHFNTNDSSGPYSFSNVDASYINYPTYSWTVTVFAHEMGHSYGSQHTHACVWPVYSNGDIAAIDSCYASLENIGVCFPSSLNEGPWIARFGTIMSYCHLTAPSGGIDLTLGFGPMPGDTIRLRYNQDSEFGPVTNSSEQPTEFLLLQNYPNPYNPVTNISFAVPNDAYVTLKIYDIRGREITTLVSNNFYTRGLYNLFFDSQKYALSSGIYFYKIYAYGAASGSNLIYSSVKKMILTK